MAGKGVKWSHAVPQQEPEDQGRQEEGEGAREEPGGLVSIAQEVKEENNRQPNDSSIKQ